MDLLSGNENPIMPILNCCNEFNIGKDESHCNGHLFSLSLTMFNVMLVTPDEAFKNEIGSIRKKAEQALIGVLVKYQHRRAERLTNKLRKLEQHKSRRNTVTEQMSHPKTPSPARKKTVNKDEDVNELAEELKTRISEVDVLLEQMRSQVCANKQSESYSCLLSDSLEVRGKGEANRRENKAAKTKDKKRFCHAIESRKQYIKNLSNEQLTDEQITLLSRGLKFIPTPVTK